MNPLQACIELVFKEEPTAMDLTTIIAMLGMFWGVLFAVTIHTMSGYLKNQPWFRTVSDRDYERNFKQMMQMIGVQETKEQYYHRFAFDWPWMWCVCLQHFVGGMLCFPAILGIWDETTRSSLACLGILSEISWEVSDMLMWLYRHYFTENGKQKAPGKLLVVLFLHHALGCSLGLPMIVRYRNLSALHWLCFDLQLAGGVSFSAQQITKALDISEARQHGLFLQLSGFSLVTSVITRLIHWPVLAGQVAMVWYQDQAWAFFAVGVPTIVLFSLFSWAFCISPGFARMIKFWNMPDSNTATKKAVASRRPSSSAVIRVSLVGPLTKRGSLVVPAPSRRTGTSVGSHSLDKVLKPESQVIQEPQLLARTRRCISTPRRNTSTSPSRGTSSVRGLRRESMNTVGGNSRSSFVRGIDMAIKVD